MTFKKLLTGASSLLAFSAPALAQQGTPPTAPHTAPDATAEDSRDVVIITARLSIGRKQSKRSATTSARSRRLASMSWANCRTRMWAKA